MVAFIHEIIRHHLVNFTLQFYSWEKYISFKDYQILSPEENLNDNVLLSFCRALFLNRRI